MTAGARLAALVAVLLALAAGGCARAVERPNVLFVLADDLRWDMLGVYGNEIVRTPSLDALAREGTRFDAFYVAHPVCNESRAAFLTGRYVHQRGIERLPPRRGRASTGVGEDTRTVAHVMKEAGYNTGFIGKAHLRGVPQAWGFDEAPLYTPGFQVGQAEVQRDRFFAARRPVLLRGEKSPRLVDAAIDFIERQGEQRWFLWLATTAPHRPWYYDEAHPYSEKDLRPPGFPPDPEREDWSGWAAYYSLVSTLDAELGRLFRRLDELGIARETLVVFTSDNGVMHGSHGVPGKGVWYEESVRQPLIVRWPGLTDGARSDALVSSVDLFPTLADLVGGETPAGLGGESWLPLLRGEPARSRTVFASGVRPARLGGGSWTMAVADGHKYVELPESGERFLYDLGADPHELADLAEAPGQRRRIERLARRIREWRPGS